MPWMLLWALACAPWTKGEDAGLRVASTPRWIGTDGSMRVHVDVREGDAAFLASFAVQDEFARVWVNEVTSPDGDVAFRAERWWNDARIKTNAAFAAATSTINWPVEADDGPLVPGMWRIEAYVDDPAVASSIDLAIKTDDDLDEGTLAARLVFAEAVAGRDGVVEGTLEAVRRWADEVYAPLGIEVSVTDEVAAQPASLTAPGTGSAEVYRAISADKARREIVIYVLDEITDLDGIFGAAGGIPGPLVASDRSVIAISAVEAAGRDGVFSEAELDLYADTIAHEVAHYLGVFHPMELPLAGRISSWDVLKDTPECEDLARCTRELGDNLMFPTPLCEQQEGLDCVAFRNQRAVTAAQRGVMHRNVAVR